MTSKLPSISSVKLFFAAVRHVGGLSDDAKFVSWLFGIAHQKCLQRWRRGTREAAWREEAKGTMTGFEDSPDEPPIRRG